MDVDYILQTLVDFGIVALNGLLVVAYAAWEQAVTLLSLGVAGLVMAWPDRSVQRVAGHRPRRGQRGATAHAKPTQMVATGITAAVWTAASVLSRSPVTLWGLALWVALLAGSLALVHERENVLWTHKGLIVGYAALALGLRLIFQAPVDVQGWSEIMGVAEGGRALLITVQQAVGPWAVLTVWAIYPLGYLSLLGQRLLVNRTRLISPLTSARRTFADLRTRGEVD